MWTFESSTGKWFDPSGTFLVKGYAGGNCGKNPEGINNPELQGEKSIGPLPEGLYGLGELVLESHLGKYAISLVPDPANKMLGRGGFFVHGDTTPGGRASEGCIILPRPNREALWSSKDRKVNVVAVYRSPAV